MHMYVRVRVRMRVSMCVVVVVIPPLLGRHAALSARAARGSSTYP